MLVTARRFAPIALAVPLALPVLAAPAWAAGGSAMATLSPVPLNGGGGSGTAMVTVNGTTLDVTADVRGLLADNPHAAHIHFGADARHECPTTADNTDGDNRISTTDGAGAYGPIVVSLTTSGDTSPDSGLAVDRFSTAPGGLVQYSRGSIQVEPGVAQAILDGQAAVVFHGNDYNGNGQYDAEAGPSDLDPSLPREATDPAVCGVLTAAPTGGAATGAGGTATATTSAGMLALGGALLLTAAGTGVVALRRTER